MDIINPATEEVLASVPVADQTLLNEAVSAASRAFSTWGSESLETRQKLVAKLGDLTDEKLEDFVQLLIKEVGKSRELAYVLI